MSQILETLNALTDLIQNHKEHGSCFNFESFAVEQYKQKGRGLAWVDVSDYCIGFIKKDERQCWTEYKYVPLSSIKSGDATDVEANQEELVELIEQAVETYNTRTQYVLMLLIDASKMPQDINWDWPARMAIAVKIFERTIDLQPTPLKYQQIKKRLRRMIQQDKQLLLIDTSKPDFMGKNLEKWMRAAKELQHEGKHITVIIDSEDDTPYRNLPDSLKAEVLPIAFD